MSEPKPGDQVVLKSGGPVMTVLDVGRHTGRVWCEWMEGDAPRGHCFPGECLRPALEGELSLYWRERYYPTS